VVKRTRISRLISGFRDPLDGLVVVFRRVAPPPPALASTYAPIRRRRPPRTRCWRRVWAASGRLCACVALAQLSPGNELDLAADGDVYPVAFPMGPQVQERWALDLVPLLDPYVDGARPEVTMLD
jgi:hypothetical protein